jgi:serine protease Do
MNERRRKLMKRMVSLMGVGLLMLAGGWAAEHAFANDPPKAADRKQALQYANALSDAFAQAADDIRPSVVTIRSVRHARHVKQSDGATGSGNLPTLPNGIPFENDLLRRFFSGRTPEVVIPPQQGLGSGVIVSSDGYILTNNHVVGQADEVEVTMPDGQTHSATVVGSDPLSDLAVIQVKSSKLPAAKLGDSSELRVGEWVVAAGNPFGLADTITAGIVSAKGRSNMRIAEYEDFIQTDAAINPGNSGGPLVNLNGEVVGINTAIASRTGFGNGVGFAIPINMAKSVMESLIKHGQVVRGWLGVSIQPLNEDLAKSFGYESSEGALVGDVLPDGPAKRAGLKRGDIITAFAGRKVKDAMQFRALVADTEPDAKVKLDVFRDGGNRTLSVKLGKRDAGKAATRDREDRGDVNELGMNVANVTADVAQRLGLPEDVRGALVTGVEEGGAADKAGLRTGDVILDVQGEQVANWRELRERIAQHKLEDGIRLLVQTGESKHYVMLRSEE